MIDENMFKKLSIIVAIVILALLTALILWPIATAVITGLILSYIFYPIHRRILSILKEKNLSAFITIFLVIFVVFLPIWFFLPLLIKQIVDLYLFMQTFDMFGLVQNIFPSIAQTELPKSMASSLNSFMSSFVTKAASWASEIFLNFPVFALKAAIVIFVLFFGMRDAELFTNYVRSLSPFSKSTEKDLSEKFRDITSAVIRGYILVGVIQGVLTGVGLLVFGVPQALLLTIVAIFAAIIPVLGAWAVWIPASLYLFLSGHTTWAIALALYGGLFVGQIDNVLRPYIVSRKAKISSVIILIGMIGGLFVFGILGLIIGPLIFSYLLLVLDAYRNRRFPGLFQ